MIARHDADHDDSDLMEQLTTEMRQRWLIGDRVLTEELVARNPDLQFDSGGVGELIYEEICLRRERGESGVSTEIIRRFPDLAAQIRLLLAVNDELEPDSQPIDRFCGNQVGEFILETELGRGLRGRVFRATQPSLANRSVILKLTRQQTTEHQTLARLQHTNIVPLYHAFDDPVRRVHALCMPDFGGETLANVLDHLKQITPSDRTAANVWAALSERENRTRAPRGWDQCDYVSVICRIGIGIAEALQFAHERNLLHLDVKPSNILLTAEGQPMLLDFHLAREPIPVGAPPPFEVGGSEPYLAPEHRAVLDAVRDNLVIRASVDGRADIFSLGVVLFESLSDRIPVFESTRPLSVWNPRVSTGLSDIVARCLSHHASDRYPDASTLAEDLRRHLSNHPLRGVRNRNFQERWWKWRRRRPHDLGSLVGLAALVFATILGLGYFDHQRELARSSLLDGRTHLASGQCVAARGAFQRGLAVGAYFPSWLGFHEELSLGIRQVDRAERFNEIHASANQLRGLLGSETISLSDLDSAESLTRLVLDRRGELFEAVESASPLEVRRKAREDVVDLLLLWSHIKVRLAPPEQASDARRNALDVLSDAERVLGAHPVLARDRAEFLEALGQIEDAQVVRRHAEGIPPQSASDHYALGCYYFRTRRLMEAKKEFDRAIDLDPKSYWSWFYLGQCHLVGDRLVDSVVAFGVCTGLDPNHASGYLQKAKACSRLGQREEAMRCVDHVLSQDPNNETAIRLRNDLGHVK